MWKRAIDLHQCVAGVANVLVDVPTIIDEHTVDFGIVAMASSRSSIWRMAFVRRINIECGTRAEQKYIPESTLQPRRSKLRATSTCPARRALQRACCKEFLDSSSSLEDDDSFAVDVQRSRRVLTVDKSSAAAASATAWAISVKFIYLRRESD